MQGTSHRAECGKVVSRLYDKGHGNSREGQLSSEVTNWKSYRELAIQLASKLYICVDYMQMCAIHPPRALRLDNK